MTVTIRDIIIVVTVMTAMFYMMVVTMTCNICDSDKRCNNRGDSDDSHGLCNGNDNDLL